MNSYKTVGRRQIWILAAVVLMTVMMFAIAGGGAAVVESSAGERLLPIYSVGREQSDKTISISFDAAWGAGRVRNMIIRGSYAE